MPVTMDKIVSLCKRRGFIYQSSEIYGGFGSCYDYGPMGVELKNNIKRVWWKAVVQDRADVVGLDSAVIMSPKVWEASGHLTAGFADELVECKKCHHRFKADELKDKTKCPDCGGKLTIPKKFNLMMQTYVGPVQDEAAKTYLRAETCQGIYVNFENVLDTMRMKIPFGIAQIGKAFRNEITPGNFTFRTREFEQMEMQYFIKPGDNDKYFDEWKKQRMDWYLNNLGIKKENLRFREHSKEELPHYARKAVDIEYNYPFGFKEFEGIHDRGDWDLSNHAKHSGKDLSYFDEKTKKKYIPNVVETSGGVDRSALVVLLDAYHEEKVRKETRVVLKLDKDLAPIKVAVLPLVRNKEEIVKKAKEVYEILKPHFMSMYDDTGSIGRLYRRQDEIGTPFCITIDFDTLEDKKVTVRDRDTMKQDRIAIDKLIDFLQDKLAKK